MIGDYFFRINQFPIRSQKRSIRSIHQNGLFIWRHGFNVSIFQLAHTFWLDFVTGRTMPGLEKMAENIHKYLTSLNLSLTSIQSSLQEITGGQHIVTMWILFFFIYAIIWLSSTHFGHAGLLILVVLSIIYIFDK